MLGVNRKTLLLELVTCIWFTTGLGHHESGILCGFPGAPAHGQVIFDKDMYEVGENVTYKCDDSHNMQGPLTNQCNKQGSWTNKFPPLCRRNALFNSSVKQSSTINGFGANLAIDGNDVTCTDTELKTSHRPDSDLNYWQIQMSDSYQIKQVAIKARVANLRVPLLLSVEVFDPKWRGVLYTCDSVNVSGKTFVDVISDCEKNNTENRTGSILHIKDDRKFGKLQLCEVEITLSEALECGKPDVQPHCEVQESQTGKYHTATYKAKPGYRLFTGDSVRLCHLGKWPSGTTPLCIPDANIKPSSTVSDENMNKTKGKGSTESEDKGLGTDVIIAIAAGATVTSVSTIVVIVIVILIMKKYYRRGPCRPCPITSEHDGIFLHNNPSSCGSASPTVRQTYSDPWDDPSTHLYDYINPETLLSNKNKAETSLSTPNGKVDKVGYLISRHSCPQDPDPNVHENLIEPVKLRNNTVERPRHVPCPVIPPTPQKDPKMNSVNELEVDAYGNYSS